jgi:hypothetical protein
MSTKSTKPNQPSTKPKKRQKAIKLSDIQAKQKDIKKLTTYIYDEENNIVIRYNEKFNPATTEKLLKHAYESLVFAEENDIDFFKNDTAFLQYIYFLLIKFYSNLGKDLSDKLNEQIPQFASLVETGIFELFFSELFNMNEVLDVVDKMKSFAQVIDQIAQLDEHTRQQILSSVESPVIKNKIEANSGSNG